MNLHEYQGKQLFADYGLPVSKGYVVDTPREAAEACDKIGGHQWVVKVQVHAGGRGKAGGVKRVASKDQAKDFAQHWLDQRLVTYQTDRQGQPVSKILVEECIEIDRELYLGAVVDRSSRRIVFMASTAGGMDIEQVARETPHLIFKLTLDPLVGAQPFQGRELASWLGLQGPQVEQCVHVFTTLARLFTENDLSLLEVNPLVVTKGGQLHCMDAKVSIDSNALYRHPRLREMHDPSQSDPRENHAEKWELNYVALNGDIGCMVNGAGLAMATMDMVNLHGGAPANFLDVGGGATRERVTEAFKIILSDAQVKAVLVNIFGGIVRCDMIAEGIIGAVREVGVKVPVVVRLEGNNAERGAILLTESGLNLIPAVSLDDAAARVVQAAREAEVQ